MRHVRLAGRLVIGRSAEADLALEGSRVSRRHAVVELRGGRVRVEDLGSANGTWHDGTRLEGPTTLPPGAALRVGGWTIVVEEGEAPISGAVDAERPPRRSRGWLLLGGAAAVSLALLAWEGGSARAERPAPDVTGASGASRPSAGAAARLDRWRVEVTEAKLLLAERQTAGDWTGVREAADRLAALDPLDPAVGSAREALPREVEAAAREARAKELEARGRDEEALALYTAIPRDSWHHGRAREAAVRLIRDRVAPARREECRRLLAAGARAKALPICRGYLDLTCHERLDEPVVAAVRRAERSFRVEPWACPAEFGAWLATGEAKRDSSLERALRARYPEPAVADALLAHFRDGHTRDAREALEALASGRAPIGSRSTARSGAGGAESSSRSIATAGTWSSRGAGAAENPSASPPAAELARRLEELDGRLVEARAKLLAGDLDRAATAIGRAAAIEAELLPEVPASPALAAGRNALAAAFRKQGEEHLALGRDGLAFAAFERGLEVTPADPALRRGLERLEARAATRLDEDPSCGAASAALSTTVSGSAIRRRAEERLGTPACRGVGAF